MGEEEFLGEWRMMIEETLERSRRWFREEHGLWKEAEDSFSMGVGAFRPISSFLLMQ